jgi:general secretion pathway protein K
MRLPLHKFRGQSGASLIAVLWLIGVLGLSILGAAKFVALDSQWATAVKKSAEARNYAESGIAVASHPLVTEGDALLTSFDQVTGSGYKVQLTWEEGLIPLNQVLLLGKKEVIIRLFQSWGLSPDSATSVVDALVDWVDQDSLVSLNGAESEVYARMGKKGFPYNRPFQSFAEIEWVSGMQEVTALKPEWRSYFTFWSNGQIDLNAAGHETVFAVTGGDDLKRAVEFVDYRNGADGITGTLDDNKFASVPEALVFLGATVEPDDKILTVRSTTKRIYSTGYYRGAVVEISETRRSNLLLWRMEH